MSDDRSWYREPETFIAIAALIVSVSAMVVGIYEAAHDRAEVLLSTHLGDTNVWHSVDTCPAQPPGTGF